MKKIIDDTKYMQRTEYQTTMCFYYHSAITITIMTTAATITITTTIQ